MAGTQISGSQIAKRWAIGAAAFVLALTGSGTAFLVLNSGGTGIFQVSSNGTASGSDILALNSLRSSGTLVVTGVSRFKSNLTVVGTISGSLITQHGTGTNVMRGFLELGTPTTLKGLLTIQKRSNLPGIVIQSAGGQTFPHIEWLDSSANIQGVITHLGEFGLGTSSPKAKLDVVGTISGSLLTINSGSGSSNYVTGNLGLGTKTPTYKLAVYDNDGVAATYHILSEMKRSTGNFRGLNFGYIADGSVDNEAFIAANSNRAMVFGHLGNIAGSTPTMYLQTNGRVGIGNNNPQSTVEVSAAADPTILLSEGSSTTSYLEIVDVGTNNARFRKVSAAGISPLLDFDANPADGTSVASVRYLRNSNTTGAASLQIFKGNGSATLNAQIGGNTVTYFALDNSKVGIGTITPGSELSVSGSLVVGTAIGSNAAKADLDVKGTISGSLLTMNGTKTSSNYIMGNLGVGTTPGSKLHLFGTGADAIMTIENRGPAGTTSGIDFSRSRTGNNAGVVGGAIFMDSDPTSTLANLYFQAQTASAGAGTTSALAATNGIRMILRGGAAALSIENGAEESFRITSAGNVGIDTTTPGSKLSVSGAVIIGSGITSAVAKTQLSVVGAISGSTLTGYGTPAAGIGHGTCWKAGGVIGYCSTALDAGGSCTCN